MTISANQLVDKLLESDIDDPKEFMLRQAGKFDDSYVVMADIHGQPAVFGVGHVDIANGEWMTLVDVQRRGMSKLLHLYLPREQASHVVKQLEKRLATVKHVQNIHLVGLQLFLARTNPR
jgi:hypothetical protein